MIYNKLLDCFENDINNEVNRIVDTIVDMAEKKIKVNKSFETLIDEVMEEKYKFYKMIIKSRVLANIPDEYGVDDDYVYALIPKHQSLEKRIEKYIFDIKKSGGNEYKKVAKLFANYIIEKKIFDFELAPTINELKEKSYVEFYDSYDYMAVAYYLEDEIRVLGYKIVQYTPHIKIKAIKQ